jgi:hypothetical protein
MWSNQGTISIGWRGWREPRNTCQKSLSAGPDSNPISPSYKSRQFPLHQLARWDDLLLMTELIDRLMTLFQLHILYKSWMRREDDNESLCGRRWSWCSSELPRAAEEVRAALPLSIPDTRNRIVPNTEFQQLCNCWSSLHFCDSGCRWMSVSSAILWYYFIFFCHGLYH